MPPQQHAAQGRQRRGGRRTSTDWLSRNTLACFSMASTSVVLPAQHSAARPEGRRWACGRRAARQPPAHTRLPGRRRAAAPLPPAGPGLQPLGRMRRQHPYWLAPWSTWAMMATLRMSSRRVLASPLPAAAAGGAAGRGSRERVRAGDACTTAPERTHHATRSSGCVDAATPVPQAGRKGRSPWRLTLQGGGGGGGQAAAGALLPALLLRRNRRAPDCMGALQLAWGRASKRAHVITRCTVRHHGLPRASAPCICYSPWNTGAAAGAPRPAAARATTLGWRTAALEAAQEAAMVAGCPGKRPGQRAVAG